MALTAHVALFQNRHHVPRFVKDYIYEEKKGGWDMMDIWEFQRVALHKFSQLKAKGVTYVSIYLSGLTSAVIAALNAAHAAGIKCKLFHYSFLTDRWLPQQLDFLSDDCNGALTVAERDMWEEDRIEKEKMSVNEYKEFCTYVKAYRDALDKYKDTVTEWHIVRANILYALPSRHRREYVELMRVYLCPQTLEETQMAKEVSYNVRLRNYMSAQREQERQRKESDARSRGGYCSKPPVKKYKKQRR